MGDEAAKLEAVPPVTVMSARVKSVVASDIVKVMAAVDPAIKFPEPVRVMVTVGLLVS